MQAAMRQLHLSARAYHRVLKLARTIADLEGVADIRPAHLAEAIQYRPRMVEASGYCSTWPAMLSNMMQSMLI